MKFSMLKLSVVSSLLLAAFSAQADLILYTDRPTDRLKPAAEEFEKRTGQAVQIFEMPYNDIKARLVAEGSSSPADMIFTKDMVYLAELVKMGAFQPNPSALVAESVEPQLKDANNLWTAVTFRARTLVYNSAVVNPDDIKTYEDIADEKWAGKLCLRTGNHGYNEALVASFISNLGYDAAKKVVTGYVDNMAISERPNDNQVIEAVASGQCDIGITNSYYLAGFHAKNPNFPVKIKFLNQETTGVHVNGSGIGISATSKQAELAAQFIAVLLEEPFQLQMSAGHLDYPARKGLLPNTLVKDWGTFKMDQTDWTKMGDLAPKARQLMKEVAYN